MADITCLLNETVVVKTKARTATYYGNTTSLTTVTTTIGRLVPVRSDETTDIQREGMESLYWLYIQYSSIDIDDVAVINSKNYEIIGVNKHIDPDSTDTHQKCLCRLME